MIGFRLRLGVLRGGGEGGEGEGGEGEGEMVYEEKSIRI
jgi:hypothetical protein